MKNKNEEIDKIKELIQEDDIEKALSELDKILKDNKSLKEILLQKGRFANLLKSDRMGIVSYSEANLERNKIRKSLIDLLEELDNRRIKDKITKRIALHFLKHKKTFLIITTVTIFSLISGFIYFDYHNRLIEKRIEKIDTEIAERIRSINIINWYKANLQGDTIINLPNKLFLPPGKNKIIYEEFAENNFKSLLYELKEVSITELEKEQIDKAILIFKDIENKYVDLSFDVREAYNFYEKLVALNSIRWCRINGIDDNSLNSLGEELINLSMYGYDNVE